MNRHIGRLKILLGLAAADALGAATEFSSPDQLAARFPDGLQTYAAGSPFGFKAGEATDDTQMTIATLRGLTSGTKDVPEVLRHYLNWLASKPPDVGTLTRSALMLAHRGTPTSAGMRAWINGGLDNAGNGGLMRVAGVYLAGLDGAELTATATAVTALTHADPRCILASMFMVELLHQLDTVRLEYTDAVLLAWDATERATEHVIATLKIHGCFDGVPLSASSYRGLLKRCVPEVGARVMAGLEGRPVRQTGYVLDTLQAALGLQNKASDWLDVAEGAALAGDDSDTVGCIAGAIAGARGFEVPIPLLAGLRVGASWCDWERGWTAIKLAELL